MKLRLLVSFSLLACAAVSAQTLKIEPERILTDEVTSIRAGGLEPSEQITITAELIDGAGVMWSSSAEFVADAQGAVDVTAQAPVNGSYKHVSPMGLVWSMKPQDKDAKIYVPPKELAAQTIEFKLLRKGQPAAGARLEQLALAEQVRRINVKGPLHGALFEPGTEGPHPGVLVLGGSNGGMPVRQAAWLASRGFAAFALAYFHYEDLPERLEAIPLEYFGTALGWMMKRPEILADHIAVMGTSRGGELALQLGSMYPQIKAVVAYVPANVLYGACCGNNSVPYAWTWKGSPLTYARPRAVRNPEVAIDSVIHVENTNGPLLLISGQDDGIWESSRMADAVISRLKQAHFKYSSENLKYSHAGHTAGHPGITPAWHGRLEHPLSGAHVDLGGSVDGNAQSSIDATPKVLEFLRQNLK